MNEQAFIKVDITEVEKLLKAAPGRIKKARELSRDNAIVWYYTKYVKQCRKWWSKLLRVRLLGPEEWFEKILKPAVTTNFDMNSYNRFYDYHHAESLYAREVGLLAQIDDMLRLKQFSDGYVYLSPAHVVALHRDYQQSK